MEAIVCMANIIFGKKKLNIPVMKIIFPEKYYYVKKRNKHFIVCLHNGSV